MSYCTECGANLEPSAKFCYKCGTVVRSYQVPVSENYKYEPQPVTVTPTAPAEPVVQTTPATPYMPVAPVAQTAPAAPYVPATPAVPRVCVMPAKPKVPVKAKVFGFIGLALSCEALATVCAGLLYAILAMFSNDTDMLASAIASALVSVPFAIVGLIFSAISRRRGFKKAATAIGVWAGIASLVVLVGACVCIFFGAAMVTSSYGRYI